MAAASGDVLDGLDANPSRCRAYDNCEPDEVLLARVREARAENRHLRQCRWSREVKAVAASSSSRLLERPPPIMSGLERRGVVKPIPEPLAASSHCHTDFSAALGDALARCGPGFKHALPRLIPKLDSHNASLAESLIQ